jgi:hypothetical protein
VELRVLVPGAVAGEPVAGPPATGRTVRVRVTDGVEQDVPVATTSAGVERQVDDLYRYGGRRALTDLHAGLVAAGAEQAAAWCFEHDVARRGEIVTALAAVSEAGRRGLVACLDQVRAQLALPRYGLVPGTGSARAPIAADGREAYRAFRADLAALDPLRRAVVRWSFTIPENAPRAREEFEGDRRRYTEAFAAAVRRWPVLAVVGATVLRDLGKAAAADVRRWGSGTDETWSLDDDLRRAVTKAAADAADHRPDLERRHVRGADDGLRAARRSAAAGLPSVYPPEKMIGRLDPLWRQPFLVTAALEELRYRPGSLAYAAALSALEVAEEDEADRRATRDATERLLGWAVLGFGVLAFVPVVGQLAVLAMITTQAVVALDHAFAHVDAHARAAALGPAAARFGYADPDGLGLLVEVLGLGADVLPLLGPAIVGLARRAGVLVRARAVEVAAEAAGHASTLASVAGGLAATAAEREAARLGLGEGTP